jgi:hypothetical protein
MLTATPDVVWLNNFYGRSQAKQATRTSIAFVENLPMCKHAAMSAFDPKRT